MKKVHALSATALILLGGCATTQDLQVLRDSPAFQVGYGDGCTTASEEDKSFSTRQTRDSYAFENDGAYKAGWRQGYLECSDVLPEDNDGGRILGERNEY